VALVVALAGVAMAAGMLAWFQARALARLHEARGMRETEELRIAASEVAREAAWGVAADANLEVDHLGEAWAKEVRREFEGGIEARAWAEDAGRWVDWNNLSCARQPARDFTAITRNLLTCCGRFGMDGFAEALKDWTDEDGEGAREAEFYRRSGLAGEPPNRVLWGAGELRGVAGFAEVFGAREGRDPGDDLFGGDLRMGAVVVPAAREAPLPVNLNTAEREALLAVAGVEQDALVRTAAGLRAVRPFESLGILFAARPEVAAALNGALDVKSGHFRVRAEARAESGRTRRVTAWYERDGEGNLKCLQWAEGEG
jgi:type II secretory pathway component PulK